LEARIYTQSGPRRGPVDVYESHFGILSVRVRVLRFSLLLFLSSKRLIIHYSSSRSYLLEQVTMPPIFQLSITRDSRLRLVSSFILRPLCFDSTVALSSPLVYRFIEVFNIPQNRSCMWARLMGSWNFELEFEEQAMSLLAGTLCPTRNSLVQTVKCVPVREATIYARYTHPPGVALIMPFLPVMRRLPTLQAPHFLAHQHLVATSATPLAQTFRKTVTVTPQVGNTAMPLVGCWRLSAEPDSGRTRSVWWRL